MINSFSNEYNKTFTSFSGSDIVASITFPGETKSLVIGELHTISYSTHREINPVRTLGRINPSGFVRGPRTIAGSLVFAVFDRALIKNFNSLLMDKYEREFSKSFHSQHSRLINQRAKSIHMKHPKKMLTDEMPPFDITILMANELGNAASMRIQDVVVLNEGQVMSIADIMTENTMQFIARDIELLERM